jgi:hypothetical protein
MTGPSKSELRTLMVTVTVCVAAAVGSDSQPLVTYSLCRGDDEFPINLFLLRVQGRVPPDKCGVVEHWAGLRWACCHECSNIDDPMAFSAQACESWRQHDTIAKIPPMLSDHVFSELCDNTLNVLHGRRAHGDGRYLRLLLLQRRQAGAMMTAAGAGWGNSALDLRKAAGNVVDRYFSAIWAMASTNNRAAYFELAVSYRAYFAEVAKGVTISFICTNPACKHYATRNNWIPGGGVEHIQCPLWKLLINLEDALVVLSMTDPLSGFTFECPCVWPRSLAVGRPYLFTEDGISLDDGWLNNCVKDHAIVTPAGKELEEGHRHHDRALHNYEEGHRNHDNYRQCYGGKSPQSGSGLPHARGRSPQS